MSLVRDIEADDVLAIAHPALEQVRVAVCESQTSVKGLSQLLTWREVAAYDDVEAVFRSVLYLGVCHVYQDTGVARRYQAEDEGIEPPTELPATAFKAD